MTMVSWLRSCLCYGLIVILTGGHLAVLQTIAWAGMLTTRTMATSWSEATASTFSGDAPCELCKAVAQMKAAEQPNAPDRAPPNTDPLLSLWIKKEVSTPSIDWQLFQPALSPTVKRQHIPIEQRLLAAARDVDVPPPRLFA